MRMVIALALAALSAGCATKWHNPDITDPKLAVRQQAMDQAYCQSMAGAGRVQAPPPRIYAPAYDVSGTVNTIGPAGYSSATYTGIARPQAGFATGFAQGQAAAAPLALAIQQAHIIDLCMTWLGWEKEGAAK